MNLIHLVLFSFLNGAGGTVAAAAVAGGYDDDGHRKKKRRYIIDGRKHQVTEREALALVREAVERLEAQASQQSKPARKKTVIRINALNRAALEIAEAARRATRLAEEDELIILLLT